MHDSNQNGIINVIDTAPHDNDNNESASDAMLRINKVNSIALKTFEELNQFWGNINRIFLPLAQYIERALLSFLCKNLPQILGNLTSSNVTINQVSPLPGESNLPHQTNLIY
ncbi:unnamed protein product [Cercopithifilaria johnstoni]|uniref:Uncharacterized protein n=1 Tax=Cercopithifilaria johnstoni TaxID=2874296 RepID=A0A8J2Q4M8_9BILA|nr:unnamed protein product [Cercopithifilaria johnstoni]